MLYMYPTIGKLRRFAMVLIEATGFELGQEWFHFRPSRRNP